MVYRWMLVVGLVGCGKPPPGYVVPSAPPAGETTGETGAPTGPPGLTGDSAPPDSGTTGCPDGVYDGPVAIVDATVTCDSTDRVTFAATTDGVGGDGLVFAMETANAPPWSEEHDLWSRQADPCGFWNDLEMTVVSQSATNPPAWYERNEASLFACTAHFETTPPVMSYVFTALDATGQVADCVAIGEDPQGLVDGGYDGVMINAPSFSIGACAVGLPAR